VTRLEAAVERLSQAQARTEEAVRALAEAQARTDERVTRLEAAVERLSHAQANTQQALKELSEAVTTLAKSVEILSQQVGKLSDTVGFGLEDVARVVLPGYLWRHFGIDLKQELDRRFILVDKAEVEINLYGEGKLGDQDVVVIGECKSRIYHREVERFLQTLDLLANRFDKKVIKVMFGFYIHPSAQRLAEANEIILVASYQR
jgi:exonuclease VII small subunit